MRKVFVPEMCVPYNYGVGGDSFELLGMHATRVSNSWLGSGQKEVLKPMAIFGLWMDWRGNLDVNLKGIVNTRCILWLREQG